MMKEKWCQCDLGSYVATGSSSQVNFIQVAVLAPLALLLVLEARCTHFVNAHFINIVCCGVVHHCQGRRQLDLVLLLSGERST